MCGWGCCCWLSYCDEGGVSKQLPHHSAGAVMRPLLAVLLWWGGADPSLHRALGCTLLLRLLPWAAHLALLACW